MRQCPAWAYAAQRDACSDAGAKQNAPHESEVRGVSRLSLVVPVTGVEPVRYRYHWILSPARLPIPSHRRNY